MTENTSHVSKRMEWGESVLIHLGQGYFLVWVPDGVYNRNVLVCYQTKWLMIKRESHHDDKDMP